MVVPPPHPPPATYSEVTMVEIYYRGQIQTSPWINEVGGMRRRLMNHTPTAVHSEGMCPERNLIQYRLDYRLLQLVISKRKNQLQLVKRPDRLQLLP